MNNILEKLNIDKKILKHTQPNLKKIKYESVKKIVPAIENYNY